MKISNAACRLTACTAALTLAFPVMAQQEKNSDGGIPEVVVTASKRKESIQSVAMAVDAVTGSAIQKMNIQKFEDVEKLVPGLVLNPADGRGQNISLRGVTFDPDTGASPAVQTYWNETPISASNAFRGLFDIGRIEVLRGPQGTLRGETSPAGSITIGTERPDTAAVAGRLVQTIGSRNQRNTQAAVNVPLIPNQLAVRVAGLYNYSENGVRNRSNGTLDYDRGEGGRISVLYQPTKSLELLLVHQQLTSKMTNSPIVTGRPFAGQPGPEGSGAKLVFARLNQEITEFEVELAGAEGLRYDDWSLRRPEVTNFFGRESGYRFLRSKGNSIEGGTSEILRNIIAERVLGLPAEVRVDKDVPWKDLPR